MGVIEFLQFIIYIVLHLPRCTITSLKMVHERDVSYAIKIARSDNSAMHEMSTSKRVARQQLMFGFRSEINAVPSPPSLHYIAFLLIAPAQSTEALSLNVVANNASDGLVTAGEGDIYIWVVCIWLRIHFYQSVLMCSSVRGTTEPLK